MKIFPTEELVSLTTYILDHDKEHAQQIQNHLNQLGFACEVVSQTSELLTPLSLSKSGCILMDVRLPFYSGVELQSLIQKQDPHLPLIFMGNEQDILTAIKVLKAGAFDFLLKPLKASVLLETVNRALRKRLQKIHEDQGLQNIQKRLDILSIREQEVLEEMLLGLPNKKIAAKLFITSKTVEQHRANIMRKMQANSFAELVSTIIEYRLSKS